MRDKLKKISELLALAKAAQTGQPSLAPALPKMPSIKPPAPPSMTPKGSKQTKLPGVAPTSSKDPKKIAEQIKSGAMSKKTQRALLKSEHLTFSESGQWTLIKGDIDNADDVFAKSSEQLVISDNGQWSLVKATHTTWEEGDVPAESVPHDRIKRWQDVSDEFGQKFDSGDIDHHPVMDDETGVVYHKMTSGEHAGHYMEPSAYKEPGFKSQAELEASAQTEVDKAEKKIHPKDPILNPDKYPPKAMNEDRLKQLTAKLDQYLKNKSLKKKI